MRHLYLFLFLLLPLALMAQTPCFVAQTTPVISVTLPGAAGNSPVFVSAGDLNGDGNNDLVTSNNNQTLSVLYGNGTGSFGTPVTISLAHTSEANALADFNGDGRLDIVSLDKNSTNTFSFVLSSGGTLSPPTLFTTAFPANSMAVGDWDNDGRRDIVTDNFTNGTSLPVYFGNGTGGFTRPTGTASSSSPNGLITLGLLTNDVYPDAVITPGLAIQRNLGPGTLVSFVFNGISSTLGNPVLIDLNGDGRSDLLAPNRNEATVEVRLNNGNPDTPFNTTATGSYFAENSPAWLAVGDVTGDGKPDVVLAMDQASNVTVMPGTGSGGFGEPQRYDTGQGTQPLMVILTDLNNDGKLDIVTANGTGQGLSVLLNNGSGGFLTFTTNGVPIRSAVGDLNGDGFADIATVTQATSNNISLRMGRSDGSFAPATILSIAATLTDIGMADVNNDGRNDLVLLKRNSGTALVNGELLTLPGNGNGTFGTAISLPVGFNPVRLALADVNKDNRVDALVVNQASNNVSVLLASGTTFVQSGTYAVGSSANDLVVTDVNGDGNGDFFVSNAADASVTHRYGNGLGGFSAFIHQSVNGTPGAISAADFDSDGRVDIAVTLTNINQVQLMKNFGNTGADNIAVLLTVQGSYFGSINVGSTPTGIALTDVTGDGRPDIVVAERGDNRVRVLVNNGSSAGPNPFPTSFTFATGLAPTQLIVARLAGDNKPDIITHNQTDRTISILGNCTTFPLLAIAPFAATTITSGSYSSLTAVSSLFTPNSFTWTAQPSSLTAYFATSQNVLFINAPLILTPQTFTITVSASNSLITLQAIKIITALPINLFSLKNGNWTDPTVWSTGYVPTGYEIVEVGHVIQMPVNTGRSRTYAARLNYVSGGSLQFVAGTRLFMGPPN